jgi:hypothetical protein
VYLTKSIGLGSKLHDFVVRSEGVSLPFNIKRLAGPAKRKVRMIAVLTKTIPGVTRERTGEYYLKKRS